ncbi:MAG: RagB/SusD family nutrient uptake outer membrane protein [Muribaculaceae bacterium]|nr:RagB/SusD family nutrient uptake outer membrane protein [Muribaculaceae bacterium]
MKTSYFTLIAATLGASALTSCVEEVFPTSGMVQSQLEGSPKATEAVVMGMPAYLNICDIMNNDQAYDWGNPALMHVRDLMTEDMCAPTIGYNWFTTWSSVRESIGAEYMATQWVWLSFAKQVQTTNLAVAAVDPDTDNPVLRSYLGAAHAFRASVYMDWARMYEFMPNIYSDGKSIYGNSVVGLTVPIVTENTTEEESRNNPRRTHAEIVEFIKSDLEKAIELMSSNCAARPSKILPDLSVAYGLMARLNMWDASYYDMEYNVPEGDAAKAAAGYAEALKYAELAQAGYTPTTEEEWLSTATGFNDISTPSWMWGQQYVKEDDAVQTALLNWVSWLCNEAEFGYASAGVWVQIGASLYNQINDRDFRKLTFVAPEGSPLESRVTFLNQEFAEENFQPYYSVKFRPGSGVTTDYQTSCVVAVPLMRVEEMYLIAAEAAAHADPEAGKAKLESFMKAYRFNTYKCYASSKENVINEIVLQKRIELWGEGQTFFDVKRLNMDVTRAYNGSNFNWGADTYNTNGRPAWMNFVIVRSEGDNNRAIEKYNNPSPYDLMKPVN